MFVQPHLVGRLALSPLFSASSGGRGWCSRRAPADARAATFSGRITQEVDCRCSVVQVAIPRACLYRMAQRFELPNASGDTYRNSTFRGEKFTFLSPVGEVPRRPCSSVIQIYTTNTASGREVKKSRYLIVDPCILSRILEKESFYYSSMLSCDMSVRSNTLTTSTCMRTSMFYGRRHKCQRNIGRD